MQPPDPQVDPPAHPSPTRADFIRAASRERDVQGIRMRWEESGEGPPVVLVHGIPTSPRLWRRVMPRVTGARLLAWEMVGYGDSIPEGRDRDISVRAQAGYLLDWLDALQIDRAVLAGHDLGGGVVQIAALRAPERCAGLLLTNAIGYDSWPIPSVKMLRASGALVRHMPDAAVKTGVFRMLMARGHDDGDVADESLDQHFGPYARHGAGEALMRQIDALDVHDTLDVADRLPTLANIPARVVWGVADRFQKPEHGERFARDLGVAFERIEGGKHFTPEDHPERIAAALDSLIAEVAARSASTARRSH
ncbi:alpha/beta fold hydrolase [Cognatilysobacter bugurensis]|uniref:Oxidoreductase n=1 Tax=Cognatilysobacter bugurensis TaxID=543356 RepID=A0A918W7Z3_9GAMM|nr:alpha/beta fold hydrolase [Lysobacter bugurensis]GHA79301.1 oxidoreductase [Lysobacter bugurensis]